MSSHIHEVVLGETDPLGDFLHRLHSTFGLWLNKIDGGLGKVFAERPTRSRFLPMRAWRASSPTLTTTPCVQAWCVVRPTPTGRATERSSVKLARPNFWRSSGRSRRSGIRRLLPVALRSTTMSCRARRTRETHRSPDLDRPASRPRAACSSRPPRTSTSRATTSRGPSPRAVCLSFGGRRCGEAGVRTEWSPPRRRAGCFGPLVSRLVRRAEPDPTTDAGATRCVPDDTTAE